MNKLFELEVGFDYLLDEDYARLEMGELWRDLWTDEEIYDVLVRKEMNWGMRDITHRTQEPKGLPEILPMYGWFDLLKKTDYPHNNLGWTIFSKKFVEVVKRIGVSDFRLIPIRVIDRRLFPRMDIDPRFFESESNIKDMDFKDDWFFGFQFLRHHDIDSQFDALPPLFIPENDPGILVVNDFGKNSFEQAGIKGIRFTEPSGF
jgi:hypothetical protein